MTTIKPSYLNPKTDHDALLVLLISLLVTLATGGVFLLALMLLVNRKAQTSYNDIHQYGAVFLVFGKELIANKPDAEYCARLNCLVYSGFQTAILLGGKTAGAVVSEAQAGLEYLKRYKFDPGKVIHLEEKSRNTLENLKNARQLLDGQHTIIISSRYHLARCSVLASSMGIDHQLYPAEKEFLFNRYFLINCLLEAFYLHWFFCGKYWAVLTRNKRMLDKIT